MRLGEKITAARKEKGWTQEQLAEQLQVSFQAVSTWERNENLPDTVHLVQLSRLLNCSLDELFSEEEKPQWILNPRLFSEERMFTFVSAQARALGLEQTLMKILTKRNDFGKKLKRGSARSFCQKQSSTVMTLKKIIPTRVLS